MDGDDTKEEFKKRFADVETSLSTDERVDIIAEAVEIFTRCRMLVEELDDTVRYASGGMPDDMNIPSAQLTITSKVCVTPWPCRNGSVLVELLSTMLLGSLNVTREEQTDQRRAARIRSTEPVTSNCV